MAKKPAPLAITTTSKMPNTARMQELVIAYAETHRSIGETLERVESCSEAELTLWTHNVSFKAAVENYESQMALVASETEITILARLINIARGNIYDYFEDTRSAGVGFNMRASSQLTDEQKRRVKKLSSKSTQWGYDNTVEIYDAVSATEKLARYLGMDLSGEQGALSPEEFARRAAIAAEAARNATVGGP